METNGNTVQRVIDFYKKDGNERVLEGKVWVQAKRIETPSQRTTKLIGPLYFEPELTLSKGYDAGCMQALLKYLQGYQPLDTRGLVFFPSAKFSLYAGKSHLTLYMQPEINWASGEAIEVFNRINLDIRELEEIIMLIQERKVSSFVFGMIRQRKDQGDYTILRRHFRE